VNNTYLIFGGCGFIGLHTASFLIKSGWKGKIILCDIKPPQSHAASQYVKKELDSGQVNYIELDVRSPIDPQIFANYKIDRIYNFAAIHREPGHPKKEYFETNILGAENVCKFASAVNCSSIVFTSSISPYGPSESEIYETSLTCPETAYGSSKLAAEYIHRLWLGEASDRKLLILRPGVVFGPGEGGNVTRLVRTISKFGVFFRVGDKNIRKAGIYVKELCSATDWLLNKLQQDNTEKILISNMTFDPGPTLTEYIQAVGTTANVNPKVIPIPTSLLMLAANIIYVGLHGTKIAEQLNPVRVRKITRSNNVRGGYLKNNSYPYKFSLLEAFSDWKQDMPKDWAK
jgi:nucleoside-diphosphate-sugar epimerase